MKWVRVWYLKALLTWENRDMLGHSLSSNQRYYTPQAIVTLKVDKSFIDNNQALGRTHHIKRHNKVPSSTITAAIHLEGPNIQHQTNLSLSKWLANFGETLEEHRSSPQRSWTFARVWCYGAPKMTTAHLQITLFIPIYSPSKYGTVVAKIPLKWTVCGTCSYKNVNNKK